MDLNIIIFQVVVLIFSAVIHEYMHGWMADRLGDRTAKDAGRLTLNPLSHIDPFGSVVLPGLLVLTGAGFVFGWAKPVPYNPYNLRGGKNGPAIVAAAGPMANFITALFFGLALRFLPFANFELAGLFALIVQINLLLAVFNLVPIPPLDGSKVLAPFLPGRWQSAYAGLERYGLILVFAFVIFGFQLIVPAMQLLFRLITGY